MKRNHIITKFLTILISLTIFPSHIKSESNIDNIILLDRLVRSSEYIMGPGDKLELRFIYH